jgi:hypothetical protein
MYKPIAHCLALALCGLSACGFPTRDCKDSEPIAFGGGGGPGTAELLLVVWAGSWIYCGVKLAVDGTPIQQAAELREKAAAGDAEAQFKVGRQAISDAAWDDAHAYLCRAAKQGHGGARYLLGQIRSGSVGSAGRDVPEIWHDLMEAHAWYGLVENTDTSFYANLARDQRFWIDINLSPEDRAAAEALAGGDVLLRCDAKS